MASMPSSKPTSSIFSMNQNPLSSINRPTAHSSISHVLQQNEDRPTTSIFRVGQSRNMATTSINRRPEDNLSVESADDETRDRLRYAYIQKKMREKRAAEAGASDIPGGTVQTGGGFRKKYFHRNLVRMKLTRSNEYKNLSLGDIKYFEDLVGDRASAGKAGVGFSRTTKRHMKRKLWQDYKAGTIASKEDWKDMERLIDGLPSSGY